MAYQSWSVVFGEQPSAAKWNILGSNDASFNDGSGIGTNAIAAASLATTAITLGYTAITSNFTTSSTTVVQITGVTVSVTIPSGGRKVEIEVYLPSKSSTTQSGQNLSIWDGTVGSGTQLQLSPAFQSDAGVANLHFAKAVVTPSAGAKTYNAGILTSSGTLTVSASATAPAFILVKAI